MQTEIPKVTIITVVFNADKLIESTILSVINQTYYENIEYIIIDGASSDQTMDILTRYKNKVRTILSEKDKGIYDAMNKGLRLATGEWVLFMNAGDTFDSDITVSSVFSCLHKFRSAKIVFGDVNLVGEGSSKRLVQKNKNIKYESICHQSQFIKLSNIKKVEYNLNYKIFGDYDYQLRVFNGSRDQIVYLPMVIANYNIYGVSTQPFYVMLREYFLVVSKLVPFNKRFGFYSYGLIASIKSFLLVIFNKIK